MEPAIANGPFTAVAALFVLPMVNAEERPGANRPVPATTVAALFVLPTLAARLATPSEVAALLVLTTLNAPFRPPIAVAALLLLKRLAAMLPKPGLVFVPPAVDALPSPRVRATLAISAEVRPATAELPVPCTAATFRLP